jgi:hypothetical protein
MAGTLAAGRPIIFRLSAARLSRSEAVEAAQCIAEMFRSSVSQDFGFGPAIEVETERPLVAKIHPGWTTREMLPHHDAHHCSFLTPSLLDDSGFHADLRFFGNPASVPTNSTILYSGFVVSAVGAAEGITTFYDWIGMLRRAYATARGRSGDIPAVAKWLGGNIRMAHARAAELGTPYLSLGSALGAAGRVFALSVVEAEQDFREQDYRLVGELADLVAGCPCGSCGTKGKRMACRSLEVTTGLTAPEVLSLFGAEVTARANDYLFWCNPRLLHGALRGGSGRTLIPVTVTISDYRAWPYERWLHGLWRQSSGKDSHDISSDGHRH